MTLQHSHRSISKPRTYPSGFFLLNLGLTFIGMMRGDRNPLMRARAPLPTASARIVTCTRMHRPELPRMRLKYRSSRSSDRSARPNSVKPEWRLRKRGASRTRREGLQSRPGSSRLRHSDRSLKLRDLRRRYSKCRASTPGCLNERLRLPCQRWGTHQRASAPAIQIHTLARVATPFKASRPPAWHNSTRRSNKDKLAYWAS